MKLSESVSQFLFSDEQYKLHKNPQGEVTVNTSGNLSMRSVNSNPACAMISMPLPCYDYTAL